MGVIGWIDTNDYTFDCMLRMERFQIRLMMDNLDGETKTAMAVALRANPKVAWYFGQKCPESARAVEALICVLYNARLRVVRLRFNDMWGKFPVLRRDFLHYALPSMGNDMVWGMAFTMYSVILGHLSSDIVAANSLNTMIRNMATVVCFGCSSSAAVILGKTMGENRLDDARVYAGRFVRMSIYTALAGGLVVLMLRPAIMSLSDLEAFRLTSEAKAYFSTMLLITSYYIIGQSVNTMLICGVYRSGGDVRFGLLMDAVSMWCYAVPVGFISAFVLKLPPMWVYFILCLDEFVKMPVAVRHYFGYKWLKNITRSDMN